jgi:hypothetical protein
MTNANSAFTTPSSSLIMSGDPSSPPAMPRPRRARLNKASDLSSITPCFEGDVLPHRLFMPQLDHVIGNSDSLVPSITLKRRGEFPVRVTAIDHQRQRPLKLRPRIVLTSSFTTQRGGDDHHNPPALVPDTTVDDTDDIPFLDPLWNTQQHGKMTSCFSSLKFLPYSSTRRPSHSSIVFAIPERN